MRGNRRRCSLRRVQRRGNSRSKIYIPVRGALPYARLGCRRFADHELDRIVVTSTFDGCGRTVITRNIQRVDRISLVGLCIPGGIDLTIDQCLDGRPICNILPVHFYGAIKTRWQRRYQRQCRGNVERFARVMINNNVMVFDNFVIRSAFS